MRETLDLDFVECHVNRADGGCWIWTTRRPDGVRAADYARIKLGGRLVAAHRAVYELLVGPIPEGLQIDHLCRTPRCVNPDHLEPVSQRENILRGVGRGAQNAVVTKCAKGHPFTPENTYLYPNRAGRHRACRICRTEWVRAYWRRQYAKRDFERDE